MRITEGLKLTEVAAEKALGAVIAAGQESATEEMLSEALGKYEYSLVEKRQEKFKKEAINLAASAHIKLYNAEKGLKPRNEYTLALQILQGVIAGIFGYLIGGFGTVLPVVFLLAIFRIVTTTEENNLRGRIALANRILMNEKLQDLLLKKTTEK